MTSPDTGRAGEVRAAACSVDGCQKRPYQRGWCQMHLRRWQRNGDPLVTRKPPNGEPLRFLLETALSHQSDDCLIWPHVKDNHGYPIVRFEGKRAKGHRLLCAAAHGPQPSPERREVAHGCGNPSCVNPRHLRWATPKENQADKILHGTTNRGGRQWTAKLSDNDVQLIRASEGQVKVAALAARYGVGRAAIYKILRRERWTWL
jgi:hypothetical protein